jgi:2-polyprenyl-3-methyl-5-hydroxy-6-metoxy-1,4-benzoquinol methylase
VSRLAEAAAGDATAGLYRVKEAGYFGCPRLDLLAMLAPATGLRILEIGAGTGATLRAAKATGLAAYVVGVDLVEPGPAPPGEPEVDRFISGNVEALDLDLPAGGFDAVLCADVLEHLVDPWRTVARLAEHLCSGGVLLASIPNLRNHRALRRIVIEGDFHYEPAGLLDRSHLRFFCRKNVRELFEQAGLRIEAIEENMGGYGLRHKVLDRLTLGRLHDFFVFQYRTRARKP